MAASSDLSGPIGPRRIWAAFMTGRRERKISLCFRVDLSEIQSKIQIWNAALICEWPRMGIADLQKSGMAGSDAVINRDLHCHSGAVMSCVSERKAWALVGGRPATPAFLSPAQEKP